MAPHHLTPARDDPSRPPLFTPEEWRAIADAMSLSPKQAAIVGYVVQGMGDKEIARQLKIRHSTVRSHLDDIRTRTKTTNRIVIAYRVFETFRRVAGNRPPQK